MRASAALLGLALVGCATVPMASPEEDRRIKNLVPPSESALVYLYRHETFGYAVKMDVSLDGYPAGQTVARSFMVWQVQPGPHVIVSKAEEETTLALNTLPGKRYFVWQEVKMGALYARSKLHLVPEAEGLRGVKDCALVKMPAPHRAPRPSPPVSPPTPPPAAPAVTSPPAPTS